MGPGVGKYVSINLYSSVRESASYAWVVLIAKWFLRVIVNLIGICFKCWRVNSEAFQTPLLFVVAQYIW